jgi:DNA-binding MarR family transcriptional regulator
MRLARRLRAERADHGLTLNQMSVLAVLDRHGPLTPSELAAHEGVRPPSMTKTVQCLFEGGYVDRTPDPLDGRQVVVSLTPSARQLIKADRARRDVWLAQRLAELTADERAILRDAAPILDRLAGR